MSATSSLPLYQHQPDRTARDRLELLTALLDGPGVDPIFRAEIIRVPREHPVYGRGCAVAGCQRPHHADGDLCSRHRVEWVAARDRGVGKPEFLATAQPLQSRERVDEERCRVCPQRPAAHTNLRLCVRHLSRWRFHKQAHGDKADFQGWLGDQDPIDGDGDCHVTVCPGLANSPLGLCSRHQHRYRLDGRPGGAALPQRWWRRYQPRGRPVPVVYQDKAHFQSWCVTLAPLPWPGQVNLLGLGPLLQAEIWWGLFIHTQRSRPTRWDLGRIQNLVNACRQHGVHSLADRDFGPNHLPTSPRPAAILRELRNELRLAYFTPADTREAGFLETDHFGARFPHRAATST